MNAKLCYDQALERGENHIPSRNSIPDYLSAPAIVILGSTLLQTFSSLTIRAGLISTFDLVFDHSENRHCYHLAMQRNLISMANYETNDYLTCS